MWEFRVGSARVVVVRHVVGFEAVDPTYSLDRQKEGAVSEFSSSSALL